MSTFRWGWAAFVVVATSAPYILNWSYTPKGYHYTWILPSDPEDSFAYMAWAQQAARGALLFKIKYTALPHGAFLFHPFFLLCGWLSAIFSCEMGIIFLAAKAIGVAVFFFTFYRYLDYLGLGTIESIAASILLGISSGFGGVVAFFGWMNESPLLPADLSFPEFTTYWSLLWNPLFPFSLTLMLLSIYWMDRGTRESNVSDIWRAGFATGLMALIHPYSLPLLFAFVIVVTIVRRQTNALGYFCRYFAAVLPFAGYEAVVSIMHPLVARHSALGEMKSPPLAACALGYGLQLLLLIIGLIVERGQLAKRYWQIVLWFILSVALAYLPVWFQRKLVFGAQIPLSIMCGVAFGWILGQCSTIRSRRRVLLASVAVLLPLLAVTPAYLLVQQDKEVKENIDDAYFANSDLIEALKVLRKISKPSDVVFAEPATSRLIPAFSGNTTVWGHWAMSVDYEQRRRWIDSLVNPQVGWDDETRSQQFWGTDIAFIFADKQFKQSLRESPFVWRVILKDAEKVFENDSVVIYRRRSSS